MQTVYVETTIMSYLAAYPSRDLVIAAHQQITRDWWHTAEDRFGLYVSEAVLAEIQAGDPEVSDGLLGYVELLPYRQRRNN